MAAQDHKCYPGKGTLSRASCEASCGGPPPPPAPGGSNYICYQGTCYPGKGTQTKSECVAGCGSGSDCEAAGDQIDTYSTASGMSVTAVTGGTGGKAAPYSKVVIMLHGGGQTGDYWKGLYCMGWFGAPGSAAPSAEVEGQRQELGRHGMGTEELASAPRRREPR